MNSTCVSLLLSLVQYSAWFMMLCFVLPFKSREDATATGSVAQTMGNLVLSLSSEQSEYSYFKDNILGMWAGPEHWKNRAQFNALKGW